MSMRDPEVLVVGGGFAGLATAAALAPLGLQVAVLEARSAPTDALRGELIHPPGVQELNALGLADALRAVGGADVHGFAAYASADAEPVRLAYPTGRGLGLEHRMIVEALQERVRALPGVELRPRSRVEQIVRENGRVVGVLTADGELHRGRLVVVADGRFSKLRKALAIPTSTRLVSYTVGLALPNDLLPVPAHGHVFTGGPGPLLAYPMGQGRVRINVDVPVDTPRGHDALAALLRDQYVQVVPEPLRRALLEGMASAELVATANHAITADACAVPGAALVGDAGGCSHPLTATGMTTGLHDIRVLAESLRRHGLGDAALLEYQRQRFRYVRARELFAQALYDVLRGATPGARLLREGVFRYWQKPRSRQASMAILSGDASSAFDFAREYSHVVALSGWTGLSQGRKRAGARQLRDELFDMIAEARACAGMALEKAVSTVAAEHTRRLAGFPDREPETLTQKAARWTRGPRSPRGPSPAPELRHDE